MSGYAWSPPPEAIERAQLTRFLKQTRSRDYSELYGRSIADSGRFTEEVLKFLNIYFDAPYSSILDLSRGPEWPRWCVGAKLNITETCFNHDPARPAVIAEDEAGSVRTLSYGDLRSLVAQAAAGLTAMEIGKGDRVAIYMPMIPETVVAMLALGRIGAIAVPLFSGYGPAAIETRLKQTAAKALIASATTHRGGKTIDLLETAKTAVARCPSVEHVIAVCPEWQQADDVFRWDKLFTFGEADYEKTAAEDPLLILFSSGTTGEPKGVLHSHCSFPVKAAQDMALHMDIGPGGRISWFTDLGWMMGPWLIYGALILGATVVLYDGACDFPEPTRLWHFAAGHDVEVQGVSPSLVRKLAAYGATTVRDLPRLRFFASSGEPWDEGSWWWLFERAARRPVPVINYSGGTEISGGILSNHPLAPIKPCGFAAPCLGIAADVVDEAGNSIASGTGELAIRQPWIGQARGFWNDSERYLETYWSRQAGVWIHGDWAERDRDGTWFVRGRSDDTLKVGGKRVGPAEIESVLTGYPGVTEAAVIGVPDEIKGTAIVALCVARAENGLAGKLRDYVASELGKPLRPERIHFVSELPKTRNGKIVRRAIRAAYLGETTGDLGALENPNAIDPIRNLNM
jgi:acetyl-CoA synthetase